jgi:hypothetical protein
MPRLALAAALAALVAAPAAFASPRYAFGREGGNIRPFTVRIAPSGRVSVSGSARVGRASLTRAQLASLDAVVAHARLATLPAGTLCPGTLPDFASEFVTAGGRTVAVRGSCSPRFSRAWNALATATRLVR